MVTPITNSLSDHDAQLLKLSTEYTLVPIYKFKLLGKLISIQYQTLLLN